MTISAGNGSGRGPADAIAAARASAYPAALGCIGTVVPIGRDVGSTSVSGGGPRGPPRPGRHPDQEIPMSSSVHTTVLEPGPRRPDGDPTRGWRFGVLTGVAVAAPLLFTLSNVFLPVLHGSNASVVAQIPAVANRLLAVKLLYALASLLLIALAVAIWRIDTRRGAVLRFTGGVLLIIGAVSNALGEVVDGYFAWGMHQAAIPAAGQVRMFDLLDNSSAALPVSFLAIPVMSLGL